MSNKIVIVPKEIAKVLGCSNGYARFVHRSIRKKLNIKEHNFLTISQFCEYYKFELEEVKEAIKPIKEEKI